MKGKIRLINVFKIMIPDSVFMPASSPTSHKKQNGRYENNNIANELGME